ncbi:MAG: zinc ribbon-containing protein [Chloroflexota bacterium]
MLKVEYRYAPPIDLRQWAVKRQSVRVFYFYTGERVGPGRYVCTFCGKDTVVDRARVLTPCHVCDSAEFALDAAAA